jgi:2-oxoglutarate dehydrogenase E1 component
VLPILIHGDAAFSGQGLVSEVLNMSELKGYATGGTVHIIVNNQIGFTTPPREARSTPYCTDVARMLAVPILHVNGEDPRAVAAVVQLAVEWRQRYHRDVVIDMYCYRLHGHNEGDEPSFTQPRMYKAIRSRNTPRQNYGDTLVRIGFLTREDVERVFEESKADMHGAAGDGSDNGHKLNDMAGHNLWELHLKGDIEEETDTGFDLEVLKDLLGRAQELPPGFTPHRKIERLLKQRRATAQGDRPVDWAMGEVAAFGTLLHEGHPVRLSGQDSSRGTFSHRHAVITDTVTGEEHYPLSGLGARFSVIDSSLSEAGVLGFEFGYTMDTPEGLGLWEAQFGDFTNGAQIVIDQFVTASEQKWGVLSNLVMLLPHGYEGQGPEHSSARLERFLVACGQGNIQVANLTTPANLFHALRRQVLRLARKPLVIMTP